MKHTRKTLQNLTPQKSWNKFKATVIYDFLENKTEIKGQKLNNGLSITGIGQKCLKIENNFYNWEDIENVASGHETTDDETMKSILAFIFEDYNTTNKYVARKFSINEDFEEIINEVVEHKQYYRKDIITGISKANIKIGDGYDAEYIRWDTIKEIYSDAKQGGYSKEELEKRWTGDALNIFNVFFEETAQYTRQDKKLLEKGENKLLTVFRMYRRGELTYIAIQDIAENPEEIDQLLQKVFKWTNGHTIPLEFRKGKVYQTIGVSRPYSIDEEITNVLHRSECLQKYYVANIPRNERESYTWGYMKDHQVEWWYMPQAVRIRIQAASTFRMKLIKKDLEKQGYHFVDEWSDLYPDARVLTFYDADNDEKINVDTFFEYVNAYSRPSTDFKEEI